jgi:hypothetical protein
MLFFSITMSLALMKAHKKGGSDDQQRHKIYNESISKEFTVCELY